MNHNEGESHENHNHNVVVPATVASADSNQMKRIPVTVLTGFLGSGKTTLLNQLLRDETHKYRFAIIENELGAVGIDDQLLSEKNNHRENIEGDEIIEVVNGCICCTVRGDLMQALERLYDRLSSSGSEAEDPFDCVIIETTGLADPAPVVQTFFIENAIQLRYSLDAVITVVDAKQILMRLDEEKPEGIANEALQQILFADKILLNKVDLVDESEIVEVEQRIRKLHPMAPLIRCQHGQVPAKELLGLDSFNLDRICKMIPDFLDDEFLEFNEKHDSAVTSVACVLEGELHIELLSNWIEKLIQEMKDRLYRYKGVFAVKGRDEKYVFQGVGMLWSGDYSSTMRWNHEKRCSRFVFIGKNLDSQRLREEFEACKVNKELRFAVGETIRANVGRWEPGKVIKHWDEGNAYRIRLRSDGREVWARFDIDAHAEA